VTAPAAGEPIQSEPAADSSLTRAAQPLYALLDEDWEWRKREFPEYATELGDHRYDDRLTDRSLEAIERRKAHEREMLQRIRGIDRAGLSYEDSLSYDLFLREKELHVEGQRWPEELIPVTQLEGVQLSFPRLSLSLQFNRARDYENYLARMRAFPRAVRQTMALMQRGMEVGWLPPAMPLRSVPDQIHGLLVDDPTKSLLYDPFDEMPDGIPEAERARLAAAGAAAIRDSVLPALQELGDFVAKTYLPASRESIAASTLPDGAAYYAYTVRRETTTRLTPEEVHELGLAEVKRIRKEMEKVIDEVAFKGSFSEFVEFLRTDPRFYFSRPEDLVTGYRDVAKRADGELPRLFAVLPRTPYGVRELPEHEAPAAPAAYYEPGAADGSRAGTFWANTYKLETRPKYEMEALTFHEAVPGHHLQIARAQELKELPDFRRNTGPTAYVEGWALYAERLGYEMGFYTDPYSRFGQLTYEMWRACRLVVDTGMHALGWSRERAIEFLVDNTAKTENDIVVEIDRYIVWPGQALAYKIGELEILKLREKAQAELGERFDVRAFHNELLDEGALPLDLLERHADRWIEASKLAPDSARSSPLPPPD
jgi:uncharacterized protein (DUF885 family)